jgi:hypothetical protein
MNDYLVGLKVPDCLYQKNGEVASDKHNNIASYVTKKRILAI